MPYKGVHHTMSVSRFLLAAGLSSLLGGCLFFTPPTGMRIGDHSKEFERADQAGGDSTISQIGLVKYPAPDFEVYFPDFWGVFSLKDIIDPESKLVLRTVLGARSDANKAIEGMFVYYLDKAPEGDEAVSRRDLTVAAKPFLAQQFNGDGAVTREAETMLGKTPASLVEMQGTAPVSSLPTKLLANIAVNKGHAYIVFISSPTVRYDTYLRLYEALFTTFVFLEGTAPEPTTPSPTPAGTPAPGATPAGTPAPGTTPAGTPAPGATPAGTPAPGGSQDPSATPATSPTPTPTASGSPPAASASPQPAT